MNVELLESSSDDGETAVAASALPFGAQLRVSVQPAPGLRTGTSTTQSGDTWTDD